MEDKRKDIIILYEERMFDLQDDLNKRLRDWDQKFYMFTDPVYHNIIPKINILWLLFGNLGRMILETLVNIIMGDR